MKTRLLTVLSLSFMVALLMALPAIAGTWTKAVDGGFGDNSNFDIQRDPRPFNGYLYFGSHNTNTGGEIWRSSDGASWTQVNADGFNDVNNELIWPYSTYQGQIYVGVWNSTAGGQIWRSANGTDWIQVASGGLGNQNNYLLCPDIEFNGDYYTGTWNNSGAELWRSSDGENWSLVAQSAGGFGDANNIGIEPTLVDNGYLYAFTGNWVTGAEIWRTSDGTNWVQVNDDGFEDSDNSSPPFIRSAFNDFIYVGTNNPVDGAQIWRSPDGTNWSQVASGGLGDTATKKIRPTLVYDGYLYAAARNSASGAKIFRTADGTNWDQINTNGFGNSANELSNAVQEFNGMLYAGTRNTDTGGEIWVYGPYGGGVTEPGTDVAVGAGDTVALTFSSISTTGTTSISRTSSTLTPPGGLSVLGSVYDVTTTASYSGTITVSIQYDDSGITDETAIKLLHEEGGVLVDRTVSVDANNNVVTGQISSFSEVMAASPPPATGLNLSGLMALALAGIILGGRIVWRKPKLILN